MNCTATTHLWIWTGAGTGCLNETPPQLRCQCRRYTYEEYHSQAEQNSRLRKRVAELEGAEERADAADSRVLALTDALAEVLLLVHYKGHGGLPAACDERTCVTGRQLVVAARESVVDSLAEAFEHALAGQEQENWGPAVMEHRIARTVLENMAGQEQAGEAS